ERASHRDLLEVPRVFHRPSEAGRLGGTHRSLPAALREEERSEGGEVMSARRMWVGAAKLIVNAFNAMTNGLTASMPAAGADKNVAMLIRGQAVIEALMIP